MSELVALTLAREVATDPPETNDRARLLRVSLYAALDAVDALTAERDRLRDALTSAASAVVYGGHFHESPDHCATCAAVHGWLNLAAGSKP